MHRSQQKGTVQRFGATVFCKSVNGSFPQVQRVYKCVIINTDTVHTVDFLVRASHPAGGLNIG